MASIKNKSKLAATQSKQAKNNASPKATLQLFMQENIDRMHRLGKVRTGETYTCTLNSFMRFRQGKDVLWKDFDADLTASYEAYLKSTGVSMNTISFYNRILRAVYNRAVEKGFTKQVFPFKNVYTGVEKTIRRGLPIKPFATSETWTCHTAPHWTMHATCFYSASTPEACHLWIWLT